MGAAFTGFATIWVVVALGWFLAHRGIATSRDQRFLSNLAFLVAMPALLFTLVANGSLEHLFAQTLVVNVLAIAIVGGTYLVIARLVFRPDPGTSVIGFLSSCYTNAGNLGLPIAAHLLGDMAWMAPIMLVQVGVLQPIALALLDMDKSRRSGERLSLSRYVWLPFRNPITVGIASGLLVNVTGVQVPQIIAAPVSMIGAATVPMMLVALGISLRLDPRPGSGPHARELWVIQALKVVVHPLAAYLLGRFAFGLSPHDLYAVSVIAALPTAQNVFVIASRYRIGEALARDSVFWSTVLSVIVIFGLAAILAA